MNFGTKIRTIARIVASLNTAAYAVNAAVIGLGFNWLALAWTIFTIALDFVVAFFTTYYNNDYTEVAAEKTGEMRAIKAERAGKVEGEYFYSDDDEEFDDVDIDTEV